MTATRKKPFDPLATTRAVARRARKRIVPNWKSRLRDYSTIALGLITVLTAAWTAIPADLKAGFPPEVATWLGYAIGVLAAWGGIGKFLTQPPAGGDEPDRPPPQR